MGGEIALNGQSYAVSAAEHSELLKQTELVADCRACWALERYKL